MRDGVGKHDILEATGGNLEVVVQVAPRPQAVITRVGEDRRVIKVRGL